MDGINNNEILNHKSLKVSPIKITERDALALQWICEQGAMTVDQLWRVVWGTKGSISPSYTYERVLRLERARYLKSLYSPTHANRFLVGTPKAQEAVALVKRISVPLMLPTPIELFHIEKLTEIRFLIEKHRSGSKWHSERALLVDPAFNKHRLQGYVPDALWVGASQTRYLIEYERARKSSTRIRKKAQAYESEMCWDERQMDRVLWIVEPHRYALIKKIVDKHRNQSVFTYEELEKELSKKEDAPCEANVQSQPNC